jgi:RNA polymerase sigma-70 factor (ECF subfamily)
MFAVCLRYSTSREEAEESLQEGFLKVFEFIHQFGFKGSFEGWIRKIIVNCCLQKFRKQPLMHVIINLESSGFEKIGREYTETQMNIKELLKVIQQLPPAYRMVFNLYVFEGFKHREIAQMLGISVGTSKSNLFDARLILQKSVNNSMHVTR